MTQTDSPAAADPGTRYAAAQARVVALAETLGPDDLARRPPATPDWTVKDLLGHLAGVGAGILAGDVRPADPEWAAGHVRERSDVEVRAVLDEWLRAGPQLEETLRANADMGRRLAAGIVTHEFDLCGAVGEGGPRDDATLVPVAAALVAALGGRLGEHDLPAVAVAAPGFDAVAGEGEPAVTVRAESLFELVRALAGRRSEAQVRGFAWSGDGADPVVGVFAAYGGLRDTDLVE